MALPHTLHWLYSCSAVYMFCKRDATAVYVLYIGEAGDLAARIGPGHQAWGDALALGMNEVHVHFDATTLEQRRKVEDHLLTFFTTPLNKKYPVSNGINALAEAFMGRKAAGIGGLLGGLPPLPPNGLLGLPEPSPWGGLLGMPQEPTTALADLARAFGDEPWPSTRGISAFDLSNDPFRRR
jgi:hypothetical protein